MCYHFGQPNRPCEEKMARERAHNQGILHSNFCRINRNKSRVESRILNVLLAVSMCAQEHDQTLYRFLYYDLRSKTWEAFGTDSTEKRTTTWSSPRHEFYSRSNNPKQVCRASQPKILTDTD